MIKWLTGIAAVVALAWSGWWVIGSRALDRALGEGIEAARAQGWRIDYDDLSVAGFPNRFDTTVTAPHVTTPGGAVDWTAPFVQVFALAYRPNHLIAVAPHEMAFQVPGAVVEITDGDLRGSLVTTSATDPVLDRSTVTAEGLRIAVADLWAEIGTGRFATRTVGDATRHEVGLSLSDIALSPAARAALDPGERLAQRIDGVEVDVVASLTEAVGAGRDPRPTALDVRRFEVTWGETRATLAGALDIGPDGLPGGDLVLTLEGWEPLLEAAAAGGLIPAGQARLLAAGIGGLADGGVAEVPVTVAEGRIGVLGLPLGTVPAF